MYTQGGNAVTTRSRVAPWVLFLFF